ncbi:hypothetical protein ACROYT_G003536 [Oculina patagonica]
MTDDVFRICMHVYINQAGQELFIHSLVQPFSVGSTMYVFLQCSKAVQAFATAMLSVLTYTILWPLTIVRITLGIGLMRIASSLPILKDKIKRYNEKFMLVPYEDFWQSWCSWKMLREVVKINLADLNRTARIGAPAPNCKLNDFTKVVREFSEVADFLVVYIREAHPTDGWRWNNNVEIAQHKSLKDRCQAAEILKSSGCPAPVLVDTMENEASKAYAAFPERLYVIQQGQIVYEGGTGPYHYDLTEVQRWLEEYRAKQ